METGLMFLTAGAVVWVLTYTTNRLWLGFKSITGSW